MLITRLVGTTALSMAELQYYGTEEGSVPIQIGGGNIDKVANFRVYDKFVGEDQALEIWDAQKDEFGRAKSSMTLQKGRLGIGTDEPQGRLAVADEPHNLEEFPPRGIPSTGPINADNSKVNIDGHGTFEVLYSITDPSHFNSATDNPLVLFDKNPNTGVYSQVNTYRLNSAGTTGSSVGSGNPLADPAIYTGSNTHGDQTYKSLGGYGGIWYGLKFPYKVNLKESYILPRGGGLTTTPNTAVFLGSEDDGVTWTKIGGFSGASWEQYKYNKYTLSHTKPINAVAIVVTHSNHNYAVNMGELKFFGTREQGQSVLHDGQLTLTKNLDVPRIGPPLDADDTPRRDRLVVEYNTSSNPTFEGAVRDTSGRGDDGVFVGTASYDATEKALTFPGTATNNIYTGDLGPNIKGNQQLTVSLWFKTNEDRDQTLFSILPGDSDEDSNKNFQVRLEGDSTNYNLTFIYWGSDYRYNVPALDNPQGKWFHLVAINVGGTKTATGTTYDRGDTSNRRLFLNGVELFTPSSAYGSAVTGSASDLLDLDPNSRLIIGSRYRNSGEYPVNGSISNFKLYDTALTAEEVKTLYDMGRNGSVANPQPLHIAAPLYAPGTTVQLVHKHAHDYHTVNSNYGRITPMTLGIKPKFSNSKILVQMMVNGEGHHDATFRVLRYTDGTFTAHMPPDAHQTPANSDGIAPVTYDADNDSTMGSVHIAFVDSPNTTGVVEYQLYYKVQNGTTVYRFSLNQTHRDSTGSYPADEHSISSIVLQEIAQ